MYVPELIPISASVVALSSGIDRSHSTPRRKTPPRIAVQATIWKRWRATAPHSSVTRSRQKPFELATAPRFERSTIRTQTAPRIIDVNPTTITTFGGPLFVRYEGLSNPTATIDGVAVLTGLPSENPLTVFTKPHGAGAVELKLKSATDGTEATATLHYADITDWEAFLLPITATNVPGAAGSLWTTESLLRNQSSEVVDIGGSTLRVGPNATQTFNVAMPQNLAIVVWLPRWALPSIAFSSRVQDVSRQAQTWGTELPVVPVSRFGKSITLINVPTDARFRDMLRVYSPITFTYRAIGQPMDGDEIVFDQTQPAFAPHLAPTPPMLGFAPSSPIALDALPNFRSAERLRLTITSDSPIWAFVSVTNNETQHVTLITPQPR